FVGSLPRTLSAPGILASPAGLGTVESTVGGVVTDVLVSAPQTVRAGEPVATVIDPSDHAYLVASPFAGQVVAVSVTAGEPVQIGTALLTVARGAGPGAAPGAGLVVTLFVPAASAAEIGPGMTARISVDSAPSVAFGLLRGRVASVDPYPLTPGQALALLGNPVLANLFLTTGPVQVVTVDLVPDPRNRSGYAWTTAAGPPFPLLPQTLLSASVQLGSQQPIKFLFGR
ncbi:MAG: HlyD family efflux transporter periplasmic adaptor subunit, partial [Mycobacteriales bacterium]